MRTRAERDAEVVAILTKYRQPDLRDWDCPCAVTREDRILLFELLDQPVSEPVLDVSPSTESLTSELVALKNEIEVHKMSWRDLSARAARAEGMCKTLQLDNERLCRQLNQAEALRAAAQQLRDEAQQQHTALASLTGEWVAYCEAMEDLLNLQERILSNWSSATELGSTLSEVRALARGAMDKPQSPSHLIPF